MILFRHADPRFPFLWESDDQPGGRWHGDAEGPAQYLADTPDGAWAEFLRHEEIREPEDLVTVRRALWAVEVDEAEPAAQPKLTKEILRGGLESYPSCQREAARLRVAGATRLSAPSAALLPGEARGWRVDRGVVAGADRDGRVVVLFGPRSGVVGWEIVARGHPGAHLLRKVRHLQPGPH